MKMVGVAQMRLACLWALSIISTARGFYAGNTLTRATVSTGFEQQNRRMAASSCTSRKPIFGVGLGDQALPLLPVGDVQSRRPARISPTCTMGKFVGHFAARQVVKKWGSCKFTPCVVIQRRGGNLWSGQRHGDRSLAVSSPPYELCRSVQ